MASTTVNIETQKRVRELVLDKISKIDPYNRPVMASIGRQDIRGTKPEWTLQELATPSASNTNVHGFQTVFAAADVTNRTQDYNYTQLMDKPVAVDLSHEAVDVAGIPIGGELKEQQTLKSTELLNDVEAMLVSANTRTQPLPNTGTAGISGGMQTFIDNNKITAGSGAFIETVVTPGMWTNLQILIKKDGGIPNKAFMGLEALDTVAGWVQQVTREVGNDGRRLTQVIEQIRGLAGLIDLVYESNLTTAILMIETARWKTGWLREPKWHPYPDGIYDYHGGVYKCEASLISFAEKANGKITNLSYLA